MKTDLAAPGDIDRLQIAVERQGVPLFSRTYDQQTITRLREQGDSLVIENPHPSNDSPEKVLLTVKPIEISITGYREQKTRIARSASLQFNSGQRQIALPLCRSCLDITSCPGGQTCKRGQCESEFIGAGSLPADGDPGDTLAECGSP